MFNEAESMCSNLKSKCPDVRSEEPSEGMLALTRFRDFSACFGFHIFECFINIHKAPQWINCVKSVFPLDYASLAPQWINCVKLVFPLDYASLESGLEITLSCGFVLNVSSSW